MVSSFVWIKGFVHPRMCYIETDAFPERAGDGICWMDPAKCVEYVLRNIFWVDAVDGITHILFGRNYEGEREHACGCNTVMKSKHPWVYVYVWNT